MKRIVSLLLSVVMLVCAGLGFAVEASAAGSSITAQQQGSYSQKTVAQNITIRIELPGIGESYCLFAIDDGVELPSGWSLLEYSCSNAAQPVAAGDYNAANGKLTYMSGDAEDTIPAGTYYDAIIQVPAGACGNFTVKFKSLCVAKTYGTEMLAEVGSVSASVSIAAGAGDENKPSGEHACTVCGGCVEAGCDAHGEKCRLLSMKFVDVAKGKWYSEGIEYVYHRGLMLGTGDGLFQINGSCTRAMVVTVLWRMAGEPEAAGANPFGDVAAGQWYSNAVVWAAEQGIVEGYGDGKFGPMENITREQMAKILRGYAHFAGCDIEAGADISAFRDAGKISSWAKPHMEWAVAEGLIQGVGEGFISPQGNALRSQTATLIMRFNRNVLGEK